MFIIHFLIALVMALLVALLVTRGLRRRGPWPAIWPLIVLLLLASWAGGMWITPFGPSVWGVSLLPFAVFTILLALFLAVLPFGPNRRPEDENTQVEFVTNKDRYERERKDFVLGWVFWSLAVLLLLAIIIRYLLYPPTAV
ncbi:hypothetical protein DPQ33_16940 [Oceanidesulfovibrio indonesiensis]|uniref:Uncharacterized protein n=1 Tax=Oceanidesulfovibrio indonesiensis TaxID=54767 RepID=A0A7M3MB29_9BACT|nr:DUF4175 domain-containing protein [Oceanidesulfovibrio indonesiensis]TVM14694.1 hypothetical protein DPQ33_16940 [Oceanidesulfovibrio indonesiensis]